MHLQHQPFGGQIAAEGEALLRLKRPTMEDVKAGCYAAFTVCADSGQQTYYVPARHAIWLLLSLGQQLTDYQLGAVARGHAYRVEYHDCQNALVLGVYAPQQMKRFYRGIAQFYKKMCKWLQRDRLRLARRNEEIGRLLDFLNQAEEHTAALTIWEGGLAL